MAKEHVVAIYISPVRGEPMEQVEQVMAIAGQGLERDRYCTGNGSFNQGRQGRRQVTLINGRFFDGTGFGYVDSRRNIVTMNVELMWLIRREFQVGEARLRGVKYCDPCNRPTTLSGKERSFREAFSDLGGLIAEVVEGGLIRAACPIILPDKGY